MRGKKPKHLCLHGRGERRGDGNVGSEGRGGGEWMDEGE